MGGIPAPAEQALATGNDAPASRPPASMLKLAIAAFTHGSPGVAVFVVLRRFGVQGAGTAGALRSMRRLFPCVYGIYSQAWRLAWPCSSRAVRTVATAVVPRPQSSVRPRLRVLPAVLAAQALYLHRPLQSLRQAPSARQAPAARIVTSEQRNRPSSPRHLHDGN